MFAANHRISPSSNLRAHRAVPQRWGLSPYGALSAGLKLVKVAAE
jgi:hypothetical protein